MISATTDISWQHARDAFSDFDGRVWLNCAHQGPLPLRAEEAGHRALRMKVHPFHVSNSVPFTEVPARLRAVLGDLLGVAAEDIILANSASYGLHLLANGFPLKAGDDVLLMDGDFPSNVLPWLGLRDKGVQVRLEKPIRYVFTPEEIAQHLRPETKVLCMSWVHSFSGYTADLAAIGEQCRANGTRFFVNTSQGFGARALPLATLPVDAIVNVGWKWLCGPYSTGFCWIAPELRDRLDYNQAYWLAMQTADDLGKKEQSYIVRSDIGARRFDSFGTANFFNYVPWTASLEVLQSFGLPAIQTHDQVLVDYLVRGLKDLSMRVLSPHDGPERSTLVFASYPEESRNPALFQQLREHGVDAALRRGVLRISPHFFNQEADLDRLLDTLKSAL